jgi:hypothetical protein
VSGDTSHTRVWLQSEAVLEDMPVPKVDASDLSQTLLELDLQGPTTLTSDVRSRVATPRPARLV